MRQPFPLAAAATPEAQEAGRRLFAGSTEFVKGVVAMAGLPEADRGEVCFAGRSNVGKSSLINALTGRRNLARTSGTPGRTQEINFFATGDLYIVDLPGYGYAKAPLEAVRRWQALLGEYLAGRPTLRRAFVLIDARHGIKTVDEALLAQLDAAAVPFQIVLTKADKTSSKERDQTLERSRLALANHPAAHPEMILTSAENGAGIATLRAEIAAFA